MQLKGVYLMAKIMPITDAAIAAAVAMWRDEGLVAFPTETVYGLGADATSGAAVAKIFAAKGRPQFNPLISHYATAEMAFEDVIADERAQILAHHFWPGPLTLILPKTPQSRLCDLVSAGLPSAAVRVPAHPVAQKLLRAFEIPIAAPSANASGEISPTSPAHVVQSLGDKIELVLAAGTSEIGLESTVVDLTGAQTVIVRPGSVTAEDLKAVLVGHDIICDFGIKTADDKPRSPGQALRHYAPNIPIRLRAVDVMPDEALLSFGSTKFMGIKGGGAVRDLPAHQHMSLSAEGDLHEAAAHLFAMLRALDRPEFAGIAVMDIPEIGLGIAINERLRRAAQS